MVPFELGEILQSPQLLVVEACFLPTWEEDRSNRRGGGGGGGVD